MLDRYFGLSIGASSVKLTIFENNKIINEIIAHDGDVPGVVNKLITKYTLDDGSTYGIVTGGEGRKQINLPVYLEPLVFETGLNEKDLSPDALVSVGGEELVVYKVKDNQIINHFSGNKCASGTGEFFKQQLGRMDIELKDEVFEGLDKLKPLKISARCSVFMKSDCTHKLNKGEATKEEIIISLTAVMADKISEFLTKAHVEKGDILLTGGVTKNYHLVRFLKEKKPDCTFHIIEESPYFESYSAAIHAKKHGKLFKKPFLNTMKVSFPAMDSLKQYMDKVDFIESIDDDIKDGGKYILGVDGGSTTTKIVLIDYDTLKICASYYGRTHGDPVQALKKCFMEVNKVIGDKKISIPLAATTGSSREILGVFLETSGVYNEIIAHSVGTSYFCKGIDTIFEIGGQDAKYVYLKNNVPIDYAMNEACSAGTGSFLEESASGDLNIKHPAEIAPIALESDSPLKFGEHCSAFINSDIRKAIQEGSTKSDIVAGLVYSIVLNYLNRVVGNRRIGDKIVLQGGVAKNKALAAAFVSLLKKDITVPPNPELLGAFGVGLLAKQKFQADELTEQPFDIDALLAREIIADNEFICHSCENLCPIRVLKINDHKYFFGGRCNKYTNMRKNKKFDNVTNLIERRELLLMEKYGIDFTERDLDRNKVTIGIPMSFSVFSLWPIYSHFFDKLGVNVITNDNVDIRGVQRCESSYCFPGELAHGVMYELYKNKDIDYFFIPHFQEMPTYEEGNIASLCPIMQGEPYYLQKAFGIPKEKILSPIITLKKSLYDGLFEFQKMGETLGFSKQKCKKAYKYAIHQYQEYLKETRKIGKDYLEKTKNDDKPTIVLFGRPYNAFVHQANMGIPRKFTTRGYNIIPFDFLPFEDEEIYDNMYWYYGQQNMKTAVLVKKYPQLYLCYITNFSCAPDSFILHYLRWIQGAKPYLVLELDSHTADAGVDTRIEAFLDIIEGYKKNIDSIEEKDYDPVYSLDIINDDVEIINNRTEEKYDLKDKKVKLLLPSMGRYATQAIGAVANSFGIDTEILPIPDETTVHYGRSVASGKECIPSLLVLGSFLKYFKEHGNNPEKIYILFMPKTTGPCRTGQYYIFYERIIYELGYWNTVVLSLNSDNSYTELGNDFNKKAWKAAVLGDAFQDVQTGVRVLAKDREKSLELLEKLWQEVLVTIDNGFKGFYKKLKEVNNELQKIEKKNSLDDIKKVLVVGEIFVRRDDFSVEPLVTRLVDNNIYSKVTGLTEWIHYTDYDRNHLTKKRLNQTKWYKKLFCKDLYHLLYLKLEFAYKHKIENNIYNILKPSGFIQAAPHDMNKIVDTADRLFTTKDFCTEATVSSGVAAEALQNGFNGVVIISPFACLPGRLIEGILTPWAKDNYYPVIAIENDGDAYPPNLINKIDIFIMNVNRS